jgi:putrescine transport system substrate-binding protein
MPLTRRTALGLMGAASLSAPFIRTSRADEPVLNIYNWAESFGETALVDFETETGIAVVYDTFTSTEESEAKLMLGGTGYDIVAIVGANLPYLNQANLFTPIDRSKLPSWNNLDPEILRLLSHWDPENAHGFPFTWGSVGMAYNIGLVRERLPDADLSSLDLILKPELASRLAECGITLLDSPTDIIPLVLTYLGRNGNTTSAEDLEAVVSALAPVRAYVQNFDNTGIVNALANGQVCAASVWSGDFALAQAVAAEAGLDLDLDYVIPASGAPAWIGTLCIPSDAPHSENAHRFLEFLLRPEIIAGVTNATFYANANLASKAFIKPEILANPAIYPDAEAAARLWTPDALSGDALSDYNRAWSRIKSG